MSERAVLDPASGSRMFYFDKADERVVFGDIRSVDIINFDGETEKTLGPYESERQAERAESGLLRQLDHSRFYTEIHEQQLADEGQGSDESEGSSKC